MALGSSRKVLNSLNFGSKTMLFSRELIKSRLRASEPSIVNNVAQSRAMHDNGDGGNDELKNNPYFGKYADKIKQAEKEGRVPKKKTVNHFLDSKLEKEAKLWSAKVGKLEKSLNESKDQSDKHGSHLPPNLDSILNLEKIKDKSPDEIQEIWRLHYKEKSCVSAVIPAGTYDRIRERAETCPMFLYPLPRSDGYEFILSQFSKDVCHFTSLIAFQAHGDNAPWQLILRHYPELKESKGIVLMTSEIDTQSLNIVEAQCLAQQLQMFYATSDEERFALVHSFNHSPDKFDYHNLIKEIETSGILMPPVASS